MRSKLAKVCSAILGLVVFAAVQDLSPAFLGAKAPFLLVFGCLAGVPAAIGAGLFTDALGGLPFGCSAVFFALAAQGARMAKPLAIAVIIAAAALYQLWVALWGDGGSTALAVAGAIASTAIITPLMCALMRLARRRIGIDDITEAA